jgi:hypothetical protein
MVLFLDGNWSRARHLVERSGNESGKRQSQAAARVSLQRAVSFPMWLWSQRLGVFRASEIDDEPECRSQAGVRRGHSPRPVLGDRYPERLTDRNRAAWCGSCSRYETQATSEGVTFSTTRTVVFPSLASDGGISGGRHILPAMMFSTS